MGLKSSHQFFKSKQSFKKKVLCVFRMHTFDLESFGFGKIKFWVSLQTHTKSVYYGKYKQNNLNIVGKIHQFPDQFTVLRHKLASPEDFNTSLFTENIFSDIFRFSGSIKITAREDPKLVILCSIK